MNEITGKTKHPVRHLVKWLGIGVGGVLGFVLVVVILFLFAPIRHALLSTVLSRATGALPGELVVQSAAWPAPGVLEFEGISWVDEADSLFAADRVAVSVDVLALFKKDIRVDNADLQRVFLDIPAITARFPGDSTASADDLGKEKGGVGFPRSGSLPGVPSVGVGHIDLTVDSLRLGESQVVSRIVLVGAFDFTHDNPSLVSIDTLTARGPDGGWELESLNLDVDMGRGRLQGRGHGRASPRRSFVFTLSSDADDHVELMISTTDSATALDAPLVRVGGTIGRDGFSIRTVDFEATINTPGTSELAGDPLLGPHVQGLPALSGLELAVNGTVVLEPEFSGNINCEIFENEWIKSSTVSLSYTPGVLTVDLLSLALPDLEVEANGRMTADSIAVAGNLRMRGTAWLDTFSPGNGAPQDLSADIRTTIVKLNDPNMIVASMDGTSALGEFVIDTLHVATEFALDADRSSRLLVTAHLMDMNVGVGAEFDRRTGIDARVSPIVIRDASIPAEMLSVVEAESGGLRFVSNTGELIAENIRVTGDQGDIRLSADRGHDGEGAFDIHCSWPDPPTLLVRALAMADSSTDTLRSAWRRDTPYEITAAGEYSTGDSLRATSVGRFKLPGPRSLSVFLPDSSRVDDLGPLEGRFDVVVGSTADGPDFSVTLDFDSTDWIDSSVVIVRGGGGIVAVDTVGLAVDGLSLGFHGSIDDGEYDFDGGVDVADAELVRRFARGVPDLDLRALATFRGTPEHPRISASLDGRIRGEEYEIPKIDGLVNVADDSLSARLSLSQGLVSSRVRLDSVTMAALSTEGANTMLPVTFTLDAAGEGLYLHQALRVDTTSGLTIDVDTLSLSIGKHDLRSTGPFRIQAPSNTERIVVDNLDLEGSIGKVRVAGFVDPDSSDLSGDVNITLPEEPPAILLWRHLWPERVDADFYAKGQHDVNARVRVDGVTLVDDSRPRIDVELFGQSGQLRATVLVADSSKAVLEGAARIPASVVVYPPSAVHHDGPVALDVDIRRFPMVARLIAQSQQIPKDEIIYIDGDIRLRGTADSPQAAVQMTADFSGWPKMSVYDLALGAVVTKGGDLDPTLAASIGGSTALPGEPFEAGVTAAVRLLRSGSPVLKADATYPVVLSFDPPALVDIDGREMRVRMDADKIPLADFDPLLPIDIGFGGLFNLTLEIAGSTNNPSIAGTAKATDFSASMAQQGRMVAQADLRVEGTVLRPVVRGNIRIDHGLIRVPDLPKDLHPSEGDAILASGVTTDSLAPDSLGEDRLNVGDEADIEVTIRIPNGFWIRGKGLDIELTGDLLIVQRGGTPVVTGELRALRGSLVTLGRTLELERGTVTFFGGDEVNPSLDIMLTTRIENTQVKILFGGTVQKPQMNLNSDPPMQEADIISLLLFGRSYEDLDDSQADHLEERSREMLASLGAVKLQEEFGGQMGIDVVSVKSTGRDNKGTALSFGKYINPRVLVSYAYAIDSASESFISLEYFIRGGFKVESTYGNRKGQSSLGVGWARDY